MVARKSYMAHRLEKLCPFEPGVSFLWSRDQTSNKLCTNGKLFTYMAGFYGLLWPELKEKIFHFVYSYSASQAPS